MLSKIIIVSQNVQYNLLSLKSRASLVTATVRVPPMCATHSGSPNLLTLATPSNRRHFVKRNKETDIAVSISLF